MQDVSLSVQIFQISDNNKPCLLRKSAFFGTQKSKKMKDLYKKTRIEIRVFEVIKNNNYKFQHYKSLLKFETNK